MSNEAPDLDLALTDFVGIKAAGRREGAEWMRERAAQDCEAAAKRMEVSPPEWRDEALRVAIESEYRAAHRIRGLPLEE